MSNKKGLTLIEVIVAVALLSIIALAFLTAMSSNFSFLSGTKEITQDLFLSQKQLEEEIESIKTDIANDTEPDGKADYVLFSAVHGGAYRQTVSGFLRQMNISGNRVITTVVAETRMPEYPVPVASNAILKFRVSGAVVEDQFKYVDTANLSLRATANIQENDVFLVNKHEWFVSRVGFNIPMISWDLVNQDYDLGRLYPLFPNDYNPVPIKSGTDQLSQNDYSELVNNYAGRHIIYTITPYSDIGKKGATIFSNPVFLIGPTVRDSLVLHLDASLVSREDTDILVESGGKLYASQWSNVVATNNNAIQADPAYMPELQEVQYPDNLFVWGKSMGGSISDASVAITSFSPSEMSEFTIICVVKTTAVNPEGTNILSGGSGISDGWVFGWNADGNLAFQAGEDEDEDDDFYFPAVIENGIGLDGKWHVFTLIAENDTLRIRSDGVEGTEGAYITGDRASSPFMINFNDTQIAEILVYNRAISSDVELPTIETYLINKYDPEPSMITVSVVMLYPINPFTLNKGQTYVMPSTARALMSNGTIQNVNVTWSDIIDTSVVGLQTSTGSAVLDNTKTVTLSVYVVEIDHFLPLADIVAEKGKPYPLPTTLPAIMSNGDTRNVSVTWSGNIETLDFGTHILTATAVYDEEKTVDLQVEVVPVSVSGVELSETVLTLYEGYEHTLTATVLPEDAEDKSITWDSSNSAVATVVNGVITAIAEGEAIITVTTVDGLFTRSCDLTVIPVPVVGVMIDESAISLINGQTRTLVATVYPSDAANKDVTWTSNNEGIATVDINGQVTATGPGTAVITATTVDGGYTDTCDVIVTQPVSGVTLSHSDISIQAFNTFALTATVLPANASNKNVTWSSSNTSIATVSNGVVTGVSAGNAVITVTTVNGGYTAQCLVEVTPALVSVTMRWDRGSYSNEPGWEIIDLSNNSVIYCGPTGPYQQSNTPSYYNFSSTLTLKRGQTYEVRGFDHWGDGWNGGRLRMIQGGTTIFNSTGPPNAGYSPSPNVCDGQPSSVAAAGASILGTFTVQ